MSEPIIIAEDEDVLRNNLCKFLERAGYSVVGVGDGEAALEAAHANEAGIVVTDIRMPKMDGMTLLERLVAERPETLVLVTTAYASVDTAIEALRLGAYDYMLKPIVFEDLQRKIDHLLEHRALRREVIELRRAMHRSTGSDGLIGDSPAMQGVFALIERVAPTHSNVLVVGESGTGKELVARAIHTHSGSGAAKDFIPVNVAALPPDLLEAQLFGHEKGAFTGADRPREGILRSAHGGTVFLDEIGELPLSAQAKLLRAIEAREVIPVGSDRPINVDFRLVAATNQDLARAVADGRFRQDLYFRLDVLRIELPSLRQRREDIPALVAHFVDRHARSMGRKAPTVSNAAMRGLLGYRWPGNVRELSNVVERALILASGDSVEPSDLPVDLCDESSEPVELKPAVERFEARHIAWVLRAADGNRERAARMLGVDPATLYRRLAKYHDTLEQGPPSH